MQPLEKHMQSPDRSMLTKPFITMFHFQEIKMICWMLKTLQLLHAPQSKRYKNQIILHA
jgi:hypothetical protein